MSSEAVRLAVEISRALPASDVRVLARAVQQGTTALQAVHAEAAGVAVRAACQRIQTADLSGDERHLVAGALLGALEPDSRVGVVDVVWSGPASSVTTGRLTSAVVVDLIDQALVDVLLVGYAVHTEPTVAAALERAQQRSVAISLLLERHADNPDYKGTGDAFPHLEATRLTWPASARATGASCTRKCWWWTEAPRSSAARTSLARRWSGISSAGCWCEAVPPRGQWPATSTACSPWGSSSRSRRAMARVERLSGAG